MIGSKGTSSLLILENINRFFSVAAETEISATGIKEIKQKQTKTDVARLEEKQPTFSEVKQRKSAAKQIYKAFECCINLK